MNDQERKARALAAADAYFTKWEQDEAFPARVREAIRSGQRNPILPIVCADGYLLGQSAERAAVVAWLRAEAPTRRVEVYGLITGLADQIEAGEHEAGS